MAIRTILTRGYGNGTFNGTIPLVVLRGYAQVAPLDATGLNIMSLPRRTLTVHGRPRSTLGYLAPRGLSLDLREGGRRKA